MRKLILSVAVSILLLPVCTNGYAQSIFGVEMGKPFNVPSCKKSRGQELCYEKSFPTPWGSRMYDMRIHPGLLTWKIKKSGFTLGVLNNEVVEIVITTGGNEAQEQVFIDLVEKFGEPEAVKTKDLQNSYGAKFEGLEALWDTSEHFVFIIGIHEKIDEGYLVIRTKTENGLEHLKATESFFASKKSGKLAF
jgi:hypothetical protein